MTLEVRTIYLASDGEATKALYAELERRGDLGSLAVNLLRAQKCSSRAKVYRGRGGRVGRGKFSLAAYDTKSWAMQNLCGVLGRSANFISHQPTPDELMLGLTWGWKPDPLTPFGAQPSQVLYVELPTGQVSFHSPTRYTGPDYLGEWDGIKEIASERIIKFSELVLTVPAGINFLHVHHQISANAR